MNWRHFRRFSDCKTVTSQVVFKTFAFPFYSSAWTVKDPARHGRITPPQSRTFSNLSPTTHSPRLSRMAMIPSTASLVHSTTIEMTRFLLLIHCSQNSTMSLPFMCRLLFSMTFSGGMTVQYPLALATRSKCIGRSKMPFRESTRMPLSTPDIFSVQRRRQRNAQPVLGKLMFLCSIYDLQCIARFFKRYADRPLGNARFLWHETAHVAQIPGVTLHARTRQSIRKISRLRKR